ncbi:tape measure protein [Prevotella bivia]|uniref:tape measure protein n=1 Tax=Prevotella bivia TaxID=28125 RepID=UPI000777E364|nr:tape measure protein [Prevotella bivia]KXU57860.1 tape measure domain protein [Prevotella bivia]
MESNNGALAFDVLIRDSNINEMLAKDEKRIMQFAENVEGQSQSVVGSFEGIGKAIGGITIGAMLQGWVKDIISVRGEFQQLEIAFNTMLGSAEQGTQLMNQLVKTAASTPFDLKGIAGSAKQLLAYGTAAEDVNGTLVRLGNIASGLSIPLNDLVYLYGTTMVQGRLFAQDVRQFMGRGIPLVQELAKQLNKTTDEVNAMVTAGQIGFPEVQKVIESLTNEGGIFYGLMEEQSKSLTGQISNLEDAFDMMLNDIGQNTQGVLSGSISLIASLVENYDKVLRVLGGLVAMYGTYKVAMATVAIQQGKSTGMAKVDMIVQKARMGTLANLNASARNYVVQHELMGKAHQAYTLELQKALTLEQQEQVLRGVKMQAIAALLTQEQQQYLSRLNLNSQSVEYLAAAESILTADQRMSLAKQDLTRNSMAYGVAIEQSIQAQMLENTASMNALRTEAAKLKAKEASLLQDYRVSQNKIQQTRVQIALAQQEGNTQAVAALKEQQHNQLKQHGIIVSEMKSAKLAKEATTQKITTLATQQASLAGKGKAASDAMQTASSTLLSTATTFLTAKLRVLWATLIANPFTAIISLVGLAASAFMMFGKQEEENTTIAGEFQDAVTESYNKLNLYFAILKTSSANSKEYKDALKKINDLCGEHSVELLKENAGLEEQAKKHDELVDAIGRSTAAKIKAKYIEEEYNKLAEKQKEILEELKEQAEEASHKEIKETIDVTPEGVATTAYKAVDEASVHIREATDALWASVLTAATDGAEKLQGLTGDAYNKSYNELITNILERVQEATGATDKEMEAFKGSVESAVQSTLTSAQACNKGIELISSQTDSMFGKPITNNLKNEIDITKLSLDELHKLSSQLNGSQIGIDLKLYGYTETMAMLRDVNNLINNKQNNLNTENGINDEIGRLKKLRGEATLGSAEWKNLDSQITKLENRLPKTQAKIAKAANRTKEQAAKKAAREAERQAKERANALKDIAQREIDLELEVEDSRLDIIKDGFEKRKAELKAQHQKELARIDKEQKELAEKYKKAGKAMPTKTEANFTALRTNENASYEIKLSQLTEAEISERKKQYELYYKWVSTYGEDVANAQFEKLVANGNTYTAWLESKVQNLVEKEASTAGLNEAESNDLITFQQELQAAKGLKTEFEQFSESLSKAKDNSNTLSESLAHLVQLKQDLQQGKTNLIGEERAKAIQQVDKQIEESTQELQKHLLETYKSNAALRFETEQKYEQEITWLKQHGYEEQAMLAEKARSKAIAEIDATRIQATDDWKQLFENAEYLSSSAFDNILQKLRAMVAGIADADIKGALQKQLDDLEVQTQGERNPFKLLVNSIKEYNAAADGSTEKTAKFKKMFTSIGASISMVKDGFDSVVNGLKDLGLAGDEVTQELLGDISNMMGGAATLAKGIATGNPMDIISGGVSLITSAISVFDSTSRRIKREMKQHEKQLQALQRIYSQIQFNVENAIGDDYYKEQQKAIENLQKQKKEYEELSRLESRKKKKDRDDNKVQEYLASAEQAERDIKKIEQEIVESLVQTNFRDLANELANVWADAFGKMEDSTKSFEKIWNTTIANAVKNSLKLKLIEPIVNEFTSTLAKYMGTHNNSVIGFNFAYWKRMLQNAGKAFTDGLKGFEEYFQGMEDEVGKASNTLEGQIKGVTEDTASIVAGEMTTMRIRQMEQLLVMQGLQATMIGVDNTVKSALTYLSSIANNTSYNRHLLDITKQLENIKSSLASNPLRAKGLTA